MESLKHLMILCCYGGVPFIDYGDHDIKHQSTNILDPTDWIAVDSSGNWRLFAQLRKSNNHMKLNFLS